MGQGLLKLSFVIMLQESLDIGQTGNVTYYIAQSNC